MGSMDHDDYRDQERGDEAADALLRRALDPATNDGCCFDSGQGPCGAREYGINSRPQVQLGRLYQHYQRQIGQEPQPEASLFIAAALDGAGCGPEDRFCLEHGPEMDQRLKEELGRAVADEGFASWVLGGEAELVGWDRPLLDDVDELKTLERISVPDVDIEDLGPGLAA